MITHCLNYFTIFKSCRLQCGYIYHIYPNARQGLFLKFGTNICWGCLKFTYEAPKHTAPNQTTLNWTMWSQTVACIAKLSCEISTLLGYYTAFSGNSLLTFWDNLSVPSSTVKKSKRENRRWLKLTETVFFFGTCPSSNFLKKCDILKSGSLSVFRQRST